MFIISNLPNCLRPGYISEYLYAKPPNTTEELQERMTKFIRMEDQKNSRRKHQPKVPVNGNKKETKRTREGDLGQRPPRKDLPLPLGPQYDHYANLNTPITKVLKEALNAELITIRKWPTPRSADETKVCLLHEN